jgi:hypothetical protein
VLPLPVPPARCPDAGIAPGRELWLLALPMSFQAANGFDKPLTRVDLTLNLGDTVANAAEASPGSTSQTALKPTKAQRLTGDWTLSPIKDVGYSGLRFGPNPMPDGPFQYWFRSDQLIGVLVQDDGRERAAWRLHHTDGSPIPGTTTWYGVIAAPKGAKHAVATVQAKLWFTRGNEATVTLPAERIAIDFVR